MKQRASLTILLLCLMGVVAPAGNVAFSADNPGFQQYIAQVKKRAIQKGLQAEILEAAFAGVTYNEKIVELDGRQPEGVWTFERYKNAVIPASRIEKGVALYKEYKDTILSVSGGHVQPEYVIALWGMESDFGRNMGGYNVIEATATLAYEGRRREFFEGELFVALKILDDGHITINKMLGSFQGAMGNCQFMPTSYKRLAVDGDGDGKRDIWNNKKDVFASIVNYLVKNGWQSNQRVGYLSESESDVSALYDRKSGGKKRSLDDTGQWSFTGYRNFDVLKKWNNSNKFAAAVGIFADEIKIRAGDIKVSTQASPTRRDTSYQWGDDGKLIKKTKD